MVYFPGSPFFENPIILERKSLATPPAVTVVLIVDVVQVIVGVTHLSSQPQRQMTKYKCILCITIIVPIVTLRLAEDEYEDLKKYAKSKEMTISEFLRNAIFFSRVMDEIQSSKILTGFMRNKLIDTVMSDVKASLEKRVQTEEFQEDLKEYMPELKRQALALGERLQKIAPYKKPRGRPRLKGPEILKDEKQAE
jgi:tRNA(Ile)-lysidine synthase TilS/MesJ